MILFYCASELGLPEDLSAIEVILYYYYYYLIIYCGLTASSVYMWVRMTGSSSSGDSSLSSYPSGSGCAAVLVWYRIASYSIQDHYSSEHTLYSHYI